MHACSGKSEVLTLTGGELKEVERKEEEEGLVVVDLVVAGAGPAGLAVASRVAAQGFDVVVVDPEPTSMWPNNYGVWVDEFERLGLESHLDVIWPRASVMLSEDPSGRKRLSRPYGRVDRRSLKTALLEQCRDAGVRFMRGKAAGVEHFSDRSVVGVSGRRADGDGTDSSGGDGDGGRSDGNIEGRLVLDATGHARSLVTFDRPFEPGVQAAYGMMATVKSHPFDVDEMLFMDWRSAHLDTDSTLRERNNRLPTFLYAMPFGERRIFLEETSLVARPGLGFDDLKARMELRLAHLGIEIEDIEEEEYCFIPMGGVLPRVPQRTLALGGTAGLVHPSTGYMVARTLQAAPQVADDIVSGLTSLRHNSAAAAAAPSGVSLEPPPAVRTLDDVSSSVWRNMWSKTRLGQREFKVFGMEVLLSLDLPQTRGFFAAFFDLPDELWQGFLSWRLTFSELIVFGLTLFMKSENESRLTLLVKGTPGLLLMILEILTGNVGTGILFARPELWIKTKSTAALAATTPASAPVIPGRAR